MRNARRTARNKARQGVTALLALLVISVVLVLMAVVFDAQRMAVARQRLQSASDGAALAGALQLLESGDAARSRWSVEDFVAASTQTGALRQEATEPAGEVQIGAFAAGKVVPSGEPDAVEVRLSFSDRHKNALSLFTVKWFGLAPLDVDVVSIAKIGRNIGGIAPREGGGECVPLVLDHEAALDQSAAIPTAFNDRWSVADGVATAGADGIPEILVQMGTSAWLASAGNHDSSAVLGDQFAHGLAAADLPNGLHIGDHHGRMDVNAKEMVKLLTSIKGQSRIWPLGQNTQGNQLGVTGFAAGQVVECWDERGAGVVTLIQPCQLRTDTALLSDDAPENPWIGKVVLVR